MLCEQVNRCKHNREGNDIKKEAAKKPGCLSIVVDKVSGIPLRKLSGRDRGYFGTTVPQIMRYGDRRYRETADR